MPPSPLAQRINQKLHIEPFASIFHTCFWATILIFACPLVGLIFLITSPILILYAVVNDRRRVDSYQDGVELAVVITGCDSGFGKDTAIELSNRGFVVFAGCRSLDESRKQFEGKM